MLRRAALCLLPLAALTLASSALAGRPKAPGRRSPKRKPIRFKVVKHTILKFRSQTPSFYRVSLPRFMDRGRRIYVGRGILRESHKSYFLDASTGSRLQSNAPADAFFRSWPDLFPDAGSTDRVPPYMLEELLFYDSKDGQAGLWLTDGHNSKNKRIIYLHWDLKKKRISYAHVLGVRGPRVKWMTVKTIGYDPRTSEAYFLVATATDSSPPVEVTIMASGRKSVRKVVSFRSQSHVFGSPFFDPDRRRVMVAEYREQGVHSEPPRGFLVDLVKKKTRIMTIPVVTYGLAFSADGKTIYAYSAQTGELWSKDAATGSLKSKAVFGKRGHALGSPFPDTLLLLLHKKLFFIDPNTLAQTQAVPITRFYRKFSHVQGSSVLPGTLLLRNGEDLYLIRITR